MQLNTVHQSWLNKRGISDEVLRRFNITTTNHPQVGSAIRIPFSNTHAKYRRDPRDERKPKYIYDSGGKVTLYGANHIDWIKPVLITEGELDTLVAWSHNIQAVSSTGGAMSFQKEWVEFFDFYKVYICFDNDDAGAKGMVKVQKHLPNAYIVLLPEMVGVKDISDYVARGGDLHDLLATGRQYKSITEVQDDMKLRQATFQPTRFHKAYLDEHQKSLRQNTYNPATYAGDDQVLRAKSYPIPELMDFDKNKALCPFHDEATPSFTYYPKTNSCYCFGCSKYADAIDVYMKQHNVGFKRAVNELNKLV